MTKLELEADFKLVTLEDLPVIQKYLDLAGYEESNHNLINMIQWAELYPLFQYCTKDYLLLLGIYQGQMFLYMPLCEIQYFEQAIRKAKSIFDRYQCPFVLSCFTKEMMKKVLEIYPEYCGCHECAADDYVYEVEALKTFAGKKLQKKRNHLNAFYKEMADRWSYESITEENVNDCIEYLSSFESNGDVKLHYELLGISRILYHFGELPCRGGLIRIDGEVKAFAIGSVLSKRMCQENIEKADESIRGLYQAMMREFLIHEFPNFQYVNREDDMGIENLRQAKKAYHPSFMIEKYRLCRAGGEDDNESSSER